METTHTAPISPAIEAASCPIGPGEVLAGRYAVEHLVGEGTFAWVFAALDIQTAPPRRVALKVLRPERTGGDCALRRVEAREIALLVRVHAARPAANVVRPLSPEVIAHRGVHVLVLELIEGPSLAESFFSHDVWFGYTGSKTPYGPIQASITGSGSRWVSTGGFYVGTAGRAARVSIYRGELSTVNAAVTGNPAENSVVTVSGWGGTWTNEGLLEVGSIAGFGGVVLGAHGTLVTGETVLRSQVGAGYIYLDDVHASWINHGDVTVLSSASTVWADPVLHVDFGGSVTIGGLLRVAPLPGGPGRPSWGVYIKDGNLTAGAIELVEDAGFYFLEGRLETGSFVGNLNNGLYGTLVVGEAHASTSIAGSYAQRWLASTSFTVAGPSAAPLLYVDGDVVLEGGALEVRAADGALPFQAGDTVTLLGWGGALTGAFASVDIDLPLAPGLAWDTSALYSTGEIVAVPG
ncbi:hypothetical protein ACMHYB_00765 [Sorangium sp. So ce1128]